MKIYLYVIALIFTPFVQTMDDQNKEQEITLTGPSRFNIKVTDRSEYESKVLQAAQLKYKETSVVKFFEMAQKGKTPEEIEKEFEKLVQEKIAQHTKDAPKIN